MVALQQLVEDVGVDGLALTDKLQRIAVLERAVTALKVAVLAELQQADLLADGARGVADWLTKRVDAHPGEAALLGRVVEALPDMPAAAAAVANRSLSIAKAGLLAGIAATNGFAEAEGALVARLTGSTWRWAQHLVRQHQVDHTEPSAVEQAPSTASLTRHRNGRWSLVADLSEADGCKMSLETSRLLASLRSEQVPTAERLALALVAMSQRSASLGDRRAGARPEVILVIHDDGDGAATVDGAPVRSETAALLSCGADFRRLVLDANREPLDLGRKVRLHTNGQRRTRDVIDRGCTMPGCDAPPSWCQVHHPVPWSKGGKTDIDNGLLRCARCHTVDHQRGYTEYVAGGEHRLQFEDGHIVVMGDDRQLAA